MNPDLDFLPPGKQPKLSADFQSGVYHKIRKDLRRRNIAINAVSFCMAFAATFLFKQYRDIQEQPVPQLGRAASAAKGVDWLVRAQNQEGGWQTEAWGGHPAFSDGVSALATLALLNAPDPVNPEVLQKAVASLENSLQKQQNLPLDGPQFYNLILTLHTLAEVEKQMPDPERNAALRKTFSSLLRRQLPDGGWGYLDQESIGYSRTAVANSAVTWWICHLLENSPHLRLPAAEQALVRGRNWLEKRRVSVDRIAYQESGIQLAGPEDALYWMAIPHAPEMTPKTELDQDAYRDYFRIAAISRPEKEVSALQKQQQQNGAWENHQDRWWRAGGKVYLTAMSVLTQVPKGV